MSKTMISAFDPDYMGLPAHPGDDLVFILSGFGLGIEFFDQSEDFDEDAARQILMHMAEKICIDKTYVAFKGTKFKNVFIREEGWDQLRDFVWKAKKHKSVTNHLVLRKAFESMIVAYMEHVADLLGYDLQKIEFWVDPDSDIKLQLAKDVAKEWQTYPGQWQDWPENN